MGIKSYITDKRSGRSAEVIKNHKTDKQALMVATFPYRTFENAVEFFSNPDYGIDMNKDASSGGTPIQVHNGIDDVLWTGSQISGVSVTFNSTGQAHTGSNSVYFNRCGVGDTIQFDNGSSQSLTGYASITLWIYVDSNWSAGDHFTFYGYDTGAASIVGNTIELDNYFNPSSIGSWHKLSIPLVDMALNGETIDSFRITCQTTSGIKPRWYLDDLQIEETGAPVKYSLFPEKGTWLHVNEFTFSVADAYTGTLSDGTMPKLPYDSILGVSLTSGINYERSQDGETKFSQTLLTLLDLMQLAGTEFVASGSDGVNTWLTIRARHIEPFVLKPENDDKLSFTISDDLSGLLHFRISAGCKKEIR